MPYGVAAVEDEDVSVVSGLLQASWAAVVLTFLGGLVSFLSPCVAPLVPGYIGFLSSGRFTRAAYAGDTDPLSAANGRVTALAVRPAWQVSLLFVGGFSAAFVGLGLLAASFGILVAAYKPVVETLVGIIMLAMGAFLLGVFPPSWTALLAREGRVHLPPSVVGRLGPASPLLLGALFAAGWTPCIGPVLAALLTYVGASADLGRGALLLGVYAAGFAVPFFALGVGWSVGLRSLDWLKRHSRAVQSASGIGLVLVGVLYVSGQVTAFAAWAQRVAPHIPAPALH